MAFSSTIDSSPHVLGDLTMVTGTFDADSVDTGTIATGLTKIFACGLTGDTEDNAGAGDTGAFALVLTATPGTITVDCVSGNTGSWWALGDR